MRPSGSSPIPPLPTPTSAAALFGQGKVPEAIAAFREAIRLQPDDAIAHYGLGVVLVGQGKVSEAMTAWREAIRLQPDYASAHFNLGIALRGQRKLKDALVAFRRAAEFARPGSPATPELPGIIRQAEQLIAFEGRLPAVLKGDDVPRDAAERLAFAQLCYDGGLYAAAARLWADALAADPKLGDDRQVGHRYNAACAAALAAAGQGTDDPKPDDAARTGLRGQALGWLRAERAAWAKLLDSGDAQSRSLVQQMLQHWKADSDLAGVRDAGALEKLPESERVAWRSLWAEVDALLARTRGGPAPPPGR